MDRIGGSDGCDKQESDSLCFEGRDDSVYIFNDVFGTTV